MTTPPVRALWIGDSFTRGEGAEVPHHLTYPFLVGEALGWTTTVDAQNGTGFVNDGFLAGPGLAPLQGRLAANARHVPTVDVVVVDGGRNDAGYPTAQVAAAIRDFLDALGRTYPSARLVLVEPTLIAPAQPAEYDAVAGILRELAPPGALIVAPAGSPLFTPAQGWRHLVCPDGFHPSAAGQRHYADVLTTHLAAELTADLRSRPRH